MSGEKKESGLSVQTLLIAGAASAVTAIIVPMLWRPGTLFAAAATPIVVALVTEALRRPVDTVSAVTVRRTTRSRFGAPADAARVPRDAEEPFDPLALPTAEDLARIPDVTAPRRVERRRRRLTRQQWRLAIVTGLVAFLGAAAVVTASELAIFGDSVSSGERRTSFFGGRGSNERRSAQEQERDATPTPTATPSQERTPAPTATPTPTPTPAEETTPEPTVSPVPTPTPALAQPAAPTPAPTPVP